MILIPKNDTKTLVGVSTADMSVQPSEMKLRNQQTGQWDSYHLVDISAGERCAVYCFYNIRNSQPPADPDITFLKLQDGVYDYQIGDEIGILQVGVPNLQKTVYTGQSDNNDVYYNN